MHTHQKAAFRMAQLNHWAVGASRLQVKLCSDHVTNPASVHHCTEWCPPAVRQHIKWVPKIIVAKTVCIYHVTLACTYARIYTRTDARTHERTNARTHSPIPLHKKSRACMRKRTHLLSRTCTHAHTHTHIHIAFHKSFSSQPGPNYPRKTVSPSYG